ncbi:hypothetical protein [Novosphingobium sp.]|nr:hypothetical protein [Novosphingobium sp.]
MHSTISEHRFPVAHYARNLPPHARGRFALFAHCAGIDKVTERIRRGL